jgi:hypothetical protein
MFAGMMMVSLLTACSSGQSGPKNESVSQEKQPASKPEPVEISFMLSVGSA